MSEQTHLRTPFARLVNQSNQASWIYNANDGKSYISGRPDGDVLCFGSNYTHGEARHVYVELKHDFGKVFLGKPGDPSVTLGFHEHQRVWYQHIAQRANAQYRILLWVYPERRNRITRVLQKNSLLFLLPPEAWYEMETQVKGLTASLDEALGPIWASYRTNWANIVNDLVKIGDPTHVRTE